MRTGRPDRTRTVAAFLGVAMLLVSIAVPAIAGAASVSGRPAVRSVLRRPAPLHVAWKRHPHALEAGNELRLTLSTGYRTPPPKGTRSLGCAVYLTSPTHARHGWTIPGADRLLHLYGRTNVRVRPGRWTALAVCHEGDRRGGAIATIEVTTKRRGPAFLINHASLQSQAPLARVAKVVGRGGAGLANPFPAHECTWWAFHERPDIYSVSVADGAPAGGHIPGDAYGRYWWDAFDWARMASKYGHFPIGTIPVVGSVMVEPPHAGNPYGHVAYVVAVYSPTHIETSEMNTYGRLSGVVRTVNRYAPRTLLPGTVYIYGGPAGDPAGAQNPQPTPQPTPATQPTTTTQPAPQPTTGSGGAKTGGDTSGIPETTGGATNTWSNYLSAGGSAGPAIPAQTTVMVGCRTTGFSVSDGNPWWYEISSAPWDGTYFASADAFYNNGETAGSLQDTPFVDTSVPLCPGAAPPASASNGSSGTKGGGASGSGTTNPQGGTTNPQGGTTNPQGGTTNPQGGTTNPQGGTTNPQGGSTNPSSGGTSSSSSGGGSSPSSGGGSSPTTGGGTGTSSGGTASPPPPQTYNETAGGVSHTWTNYQDAGGSEGPSIGAGETVQVSCKVSGFAVADGNTWWYRIASAPWSNGFYVSADAFYNDGSTSGPLQGTPFVDPAVPTC